MAVVKANYVKRGIGEKQRAKATIRYISHRRDNDGQKVTRPLFGFDGPVTKEQVYRMIDAAPDTGKYFYRIVVSPAPKREDRYRDLNLEDLTIDTMLALEKRLGTPVQFVAAIHDDHSPHRHVHTFAVVTGNRLTRADFQSLRDVATGRALAQRELLDYRYQRQRAKHRSYPRRTTKQLHRPAFPRLPSYCSYTCPHCGYYQALPYAVRGYRCPADGRYMRRERSTGLYQATRREVGLELSLSSP
jgi:hypothetical protein